MNGYFAEIDKNNAVIRVIVAPSLEWCKGVFRGIWIETFPEKDGHNYASKGYAYHEDLKNFSAPCLFASWTLNEKCLWEAPVEKPVDKDSYIWDEATKTWADKPILLSAEISKEA